MGMVEKHMFLVGVDLTRIQVQIVYLGAIPENTNRIVRK